MVAISKTAIDLRKNLVLGALSNGNYMLKQPYKVELNNGDIILIHRGYETNGADIPRLFWRLYPPYSPEYMPAVVLHDFLCDKAIENARDYDEMQEMFLYADNAFCETLEKLNISKIKVKIFYNAVRLWHNLRY